MKIYISEYLKRLKCLNKYLPTIIWVKTSWTWSRPIGREPCGCIWQSCSVYPGNQLTRRELPIQKAVKWFYHFSNFTTLNVVESIQKFRALVGNCSHHVTTKLLLTLFLHLFLSVSFSLNIYVYIYVHTMVLSTILASMQIYITYK